MVETQAEASWCTQRWQRVGDGECGPELRSTFTLVCSLATTISKCSLGRRFRVLWGLWASECTETAAAKWGRGRPGLSSGLASPSLVRPPDPSAGTTGPDPKLSLTAEKHPEVIWGSGPAGLSPIPIRNHNILSIQMLVGECRCCLANKISGPVGVAFYNLINLEEMNYFLTWFILLLFLLTFLRQC